MNTIQLLQALIDSAQKIVFFGGAGVSTESGIPDFRSVDGLYNQTYRFPPETILSHTFFVQHPDEFYTFYRKKMLCLDAKPNAAHFKLAQLERKGKLLAVITQNIDGLHQASGSHTVYELHGSVHRNYCLKCHKEYTAEFIKQSTGIPTCPCGGLIKPDVVLYEEPLNQNTIQGAIDALKQSDLLIIGGTSLSVYPASGFVRYYNGKIVIINRSATPLDNHADLLISESIGKTLEQLSV